MTCFWLAYMAPSSTWQANGVIMIELKKMWIFQTLSFYLTGVDLCSDESGG